MLMMSLPLLWVKRILLNYTLVGIAMSIIVNVILKSIFQCPRPNQRVTPTSFIEGVYLSIDRSERGDPYGFPSGHSQQSAFIVTTIYHAFGLKPITMVMALYTVIIMWHRVYSGKHYKYQVIGGAIVGVVLATLIYRAYKTNLMGSIMHKLDDWSMMRM